MAVFYNGNSGTVSSGEQAQPAEDTVPLLPL